MVYLWEFPFRAEVWGTAGQWASSVFAFASVLVALSIVRRDRQKEEWRQARLVKLNYDLRVEKEATGKSQFMVKKYTYVFKISNGSDYLISNAQVVVTSKGFKLLQGWEPAGAAPIAVIPSGGSEEIIVLESPLEKHPDVAPYRGCDIKLVFNDDTGLTWEYDAKTYVLHPRRPAFVRRLKRYFSVGAPK